MKKEMKTNNKSNPLENAIQALLVSHHNRLFTSIEIRDILSPIIEVEVNDIAKIMWDKGYRLVYDIERQLVWYCGDL